MRRTSPSENRRRPPRLGSYRPTVESLEDRLPPGDVLLGRVLGWSWLGQGLFVPGPDPLTAMSGQAETRWTEYRTEPSNSFVATEVGRSRAALLFAGAFLSAHGDRADASGKPGEADQAAAAPNRLAYHDVLRLEKDLVGRLIASDFDALLSLPSSFDAAPKRASPGLAGTESKAAAPADRGASPGAGTLSPSGAQGSQTPAGTSFAGAPGLRSSSPDIATGNILDGTGIGLQARVAGRGALAGAAPGSAGLPPGGKTLPGIPQAVPDEAVTDEDVPVNLYWLTYNDTDPAGDALTLTGVTQGLHGSAVLQPDQSVSYSPSSHWFGTDAFTYTIQNSTGGTATGNVTVTVNHVKPPPTADAKNLATNQNTPASVILSGTDVEGASLQFFVEDNPSNGTLSAVSGNTVTYVPNGNFSGTDTFTSKATDGQQPSAPAQVTITVNQVVQGPGVTITPRGGSLSVLEPGLPPQGPTDSGTYTVVLNTQPSAAVVVTVNADPQLQATPTSLTFTPLNWSVAQTVTVQAVNDQIAQGVHTVTISHSAASADPTYNNISIPSLPVSVADTDFAWIAVDPSGTPGDLNELGPTSATWLVQLTSKPTANVTVTLAPDNQVTLSASSLTFTPATWATAQAVTLTLIPETAADGYHHTTVTLTASSTDATYQNLTTSFSQNITDKDGPNALPDEVSTLGNTPGTFNVLANDIDPQAYVLSVTGVSQPLHGSVVINAGTTVTYTPQADWSGVDTFTYTINNGHGGSDSGTVTVTVGAVNRPPVVTNPGSQANAEDDRVSLQINATDPDGDGLLYTAIGLPPGLVMEPMTGRIWGWVDPRAVGSYTTAVTADDFNGGTATVSFPWTVTHRNHPPVLRRWDDLVTAVGELGGASVTAADIDPGDTFSFTVTGLPPGVAYLPAQNMISGVTTTAGSYSVGVTVSDGHGGSDQDLFVWNVLPSGTTPIATVDTGESGGTDIALVNPATPFRASVSLANPSDPTTPYAVTLALLGGRSTIAPAAVTLRHGESAFVTITPAKVSQKVKDITVTASVAGYETGRAHMTNAGFVLPSKVRAPDTPAGMKNRISLGAGTWSSYYGAVTVAPNLQNLYNNVDLGVQRPAVDDKYGNAAVPLDQRQRLKVTTQLVVGVEGTVQTAATPEGGGNADNLRLAALVPSRPATIRAPSALRVRRGRHSHGNTA